MSEEKEGGKNYYNEKEEVGEGEVKCLSVLRISMPYYEEIQMQLYMSAFNYVMPGFIQSF